MVTNISEEETQQLLRTVEMFEAITQSQPNDYQSLEILKEAYNKLGRRPESLRVSKKLAATYVNLGQISQAILEYEGILQESPDDESVRAALAELEAKTSKRVVPQVAQPAPAPEASKQSSRRGSAKESKPTDLRGQTELGDRALADALVAERLVTTQAVQPLLQRLKTQRPTSAEKGQALSLVQLLVDEQIAALEDVLTVLVDKSGLPYLPLSGYDVERDIACLLPQDFCFHHCIIPFDLISRSVLIATANPLDAGARDQIRSMLDYNIFWYIAPPQEIATALRHVHGFDGATKNGARTS
jgi:tetratricopeptide (TPR) repeat protein